MHIACHFALYIRKNVKSDIRAGSGTRQPAFSLRFAAYNESIVQAWASFACHNIERGRHDEIATMSLFAAYMPIF